MGRDRRFRRSVDNMQADKKTMHHLKDRLLDPRSSSHPPKPLLHAIATLIGDEEIVAAMATRDGAGDSQPGRWRCVILTAKRLVDAQAARDDVLFYELGPQNQEATELCVRSWRRKQVSRLEVRSVRDADSEFGDGWKWDPIVAVILNDGYVLNLPPDAAPAHHSQNEELERFVSALRL